MVSSSQICYATILLLSIFAAWPIRFSPRATSSLDEWIATQTPNALNGILNNIGADGSMVSGVYEGVVIASPSKYDPDCM